MSKIVSSDLNRLIILSALFASCCTDISAHILFSSAEITKHQTCRNPNGRLGFCISIYDCESLKYVLRNRLEPHYRFVRLSQCFDPNEKGNYPLVCCNYDYRFDGSGSLASDQRIRFPDPESTTEAAHVPATTAPKELKKETRKFPKPPECGAVTISNKIYGGVEAELTEFSWMVNLEYTRANGAIVSVCAGSIINERYILTAAHCIKGEIERKIGILTSVRIGDHNTVTALDCNQKYGCLAAPQSIGIEAVTVHEHFGANAALRIHQHNDIALLRLESPIQFSDFLQPVCLPNVERPARSLDPGIKLTVAGWGHNGTVKSTAEKRKVVLPVVDQEDCTNIHANFFHVAKEQLCAGGTFKQDSCTGDSGGPLMRFTPQGWVLEGLVSFGRGCGLEHPGIYTRIRSYLDWIDRNVHL